MFSHNASKTFLLPILKLDIFLKKILSFCYGLTQYDVHESIQPLALSQTRPWFYMSAVQVFWKHCRKRRNCSLRALVKTCLQYMSFENTVGKGQVALNEQLLLFPVFSTLLENVLPFSSNFKLSPTNSFGLVSVWRSLKFVIWERVCVHELIQSTSGSDGHRPLAQNLQSDLSSNNTWEISILSLFFIDWQYQVLSCA